MCDVALVCPYAPVVYGPENEKRPRPLSHLQVAALAVKVPTSWKKERKSNATKGPWQRYSKLKRVSVRLLAGTLAAARPATPVAASASHSRWVNTGVTPPAKGPTYRFTASGNGTGNTSPFTIPTTTSQWQLASSYNCVSFGSSGDYSVDINSRAGNGATDLDFNDNGADTQGLGGDGVDTFYDTGTIKFQICASCNWTLRVVK